MDKPEQSPFKTFENLARKLFAVPRKELEKKLTEYDKEKQKRKAHKHHTMLNGSKDM